MWSEWLEWGICSSTCGLGSRRRIRTCTSPPPSENGGDGCQGSDRLYAACLGEILCDPYHKMPEYLWTHVVDAKESNTLIASVLVACCLTFIVMFLWYMRNAYLVDTKQLTKEAEDEFDHVVLKVLQMLETRKKSRVKSQEAEAQRTLIRNTLHAVDSGSILGRIISACSNLSGKQSENIRRQAEVQKKLGDITCLKHELNRIALTLSQRTKDREKILEALRNYNRTAAHMKQEQLEEDVGLVRQSERLLMALTLKSTLDDMEKNEDHEGMKRMLTVVVGKGLFDVLDDFRTANDKLVSLNTISRYKSILMTLSRQRVAELQRYRNPTRSIHDTLVGALLILGVNELRTKDWISCLHHCYDGHDFQWRLKNFSLDNLHPSIAARALEILGRYAHEDIKASSKTVYYFYAWAHSTATYKMRTVSGFVAPATMKQQIQILRCRRFSLSRKLQTNSTDSGTNETSGGLQ